MTEIDRIFDDSRKRMDARYDEMITEFRAKSKQEIDKAFKRFMLICIGIFTVTGLLFWIGSIVMVMVSK